MKAERNETSGLGSLAAIFDALDRGKAIVPTGGGALIELDAEAYTYKLSGTAVMVCDADDVAALREFLSLGDGPSLRSALFGLRGGEAR